MRKYTVNGEFLPIYHLSTGRFSAGAIGGGHIIG